METNFTLCATKKKILTLVLSEKNFLNETKDHNLPLQVKWSFPYIVATVSNIYLLISMLSLEIQLSEREICNPINWFTQPHFCACVMSGHGFPMLYIVVFLWKSMSWLERSQKCGGINQVIGVITFSSLIIVSPATIQI